MTTTGFYMKPFNAADTNVTIQTANDSRFNGTTGGNVVGSVPVKSVVTLAVTPLGGPISASGITPSDQIQTWSVATIGDTFQIMSTDAQAGEFFVQYYTIRKFPCTVSFSLLSLFRGISNLFDHSSWSPNDCWTHPNHYQIDHRHSVPDLNSDSCAWSEILVNTYTSS